MICGLSALFITEIGWICVVVPALYAVAIVRGQPIRRPRRS